MSVTVRIPTTLRPLSGGASSVTVAGANLRDVLKALDAAHPGFAAKLLDQDGNLHKFVNVFVADDDVRYLKGLDTPVLGGQTVSIVPAVAGGQTVSIVPAVAGGQTMSTALNVDSGR